ncbi:MAG: hypothetical protein JO081_17900 [Alphaproteobacteria bacterium]|nr:hypothetical protein [Alphaproteobacteria bacterium]
MKGEAAEIAERLAGRIATLAPELFPDGHREGQLWRVGSLAGEPGQSLAINLGGRYHGHYYDFSSDERGDALDLVAHRYCQGDLRQAIDWGRAWLGMPERAAEPRIANAAPSTDPERNRRAALAIWYAARPLVAGDPVVTYLAGRAIRLDRMGRFPAALRYHPSLWNSESRQHWPAMVALIGHGRTGKPIAVHRTWLAPRNLACEDGPVAAKAPLHHAKASLGQYRGGYIRLWRGAGRRVWMPEQPGEACVLSEGIEDLLSFIQDHPRARGACAVSLSAMLHIELPVELGRIYLLLQSDPQGSAATRVLERVIARWRDGEGRRVFVAPRNGRFKDYNEYVCWREGQPPHER